MTEKPESMENNAARDNRKIEVGYNLLNLNGGKV